MIFTYLLKNIIVIIALLFFIFNKGLRQKGVYVRSIIFGIETGGQLRARLLPLPCVIVIDGFVKVVHCFDFRFQDLVPWLYALPTVAFKATQIKLT